MSIKDVVPISIRNLFSDRNNIEKLPEKIQLENLDERTRVGIFNLWSEVYYEVVWHGNLQNEDRQQLIRMIVIDLYNQLMPAWNSIKEDVVLSNIQNTIINDTYNKIFDLLEYTIPRFQIIEDKFNYRNNNYFARFNDLFKREFVGYRFINKQISKISDSIEVKAISEIFVNSGDTIRNHISKANAFLSDRENPDYQNSIKESISALEALSQIVTGSKGSAATLGKMLKKLENDGIIYGAMKSGFSALYGFASESRGVRHGNIGGEKVTFEEAKYILVISTAFINFVMAKMKN